MSEKKRFKPGAFACWPRHTVNIGENTSSDGAAVVAAPPDQHHSELRDLGLCLKNVALFDGGDARAAVRGHGDARGLVSVVACYDAVGDGDVG
jgi:hypothetical protein